jgi:hypothetical protein
MLQIWINRTQAPASQPRRVKPMYIAPPPGQNMVYELLDVVTPVYTACLSTRFRILLLNSVYFLFVS